MASVECHTEYSSFSTLEYLLKSGSLQQRKRSKSAILHTDSTRATYIQLTDSKQSFIAEIADENKQNERRRNKTELTKELMEMAMETRVPVTSFEKHAKSLIQSNRFDETVVDSDGLNLLMVAMLAKNIPAMRVIFYLGLWSQMSQYVVRNVSGELSYVGKDVKAFAQTVVKSKKVLAEVNKLDVLEESLSALHKACRQGNVELVKNLLETVPKEELSKRDEEGNSPLHYACVHGSVKLVKILVKKGAQLKVVNYQEENLLHAATKHANYTVIRYLLACRKLEVSEKDKGGKSPVLYTAETGKVAPLSILLLAGVELDPNILGVAAQNGCLHYMKFAMNKGLSLSHVDKHKKTLLHHACLQGHLNIIGYLLEEMDNIPEVMLAKDRAGRTILHVCCESEADQEVPLKRLLEAARKAGVLKTLIDDRDFYTGVGSCVMVSGKDKGRPAFHYVVTKRTLTSMFEKKVRSGLVDVAKYGVIIKSGWGESPTQEEITQVEDKLYSRAEPSNNPTRDATPLHIAAFKEKLGLVRLLLEYGADVNAQDSFGMTAAHLAAMRGNIVLLKVLQKAGAELSLTDAEGRDAVKIAKENEHLNIVHYVGGANLVSGSKTFVSTIHSKLPMLSRDHLEKLRSEGKDVRKHLITSLRDMQIDINVLLLSLGSSPIMEETR